MLASGVPRGLRGSAFPISSAWVDAHQHPWHALEPGFSRGEPARKIRQVAEFSRGFQCVPRYRQ